MSSIAQTPAKMAKTEEGPQITRRFVPARSGGELYNAGKPLSACETPTQEQEWIDAWNRGFIAYAKAAEIGGLPVTCIDTLQIHW